MKILHLEDNPHDAELAQHSIRKEWPHCEINVVSNRDDFMRQLDQPCDLILSDFSLHNFNGLEALHLARAKDSAKPVIFLSGTIGEERALDALRAGATDYVIKDRPQRLVPAIRRALRDITEKQEREKIREQLVRVQRLENLGVLAVGIAHDLNNILTPVLLGVALLRHRVSGTEEQRLLNNMENSANRGAHLVKQIMGFTHATTGEPQLVQSKHLLRELAEMIHQTFPKHILLRESIEATLWPVKINPTQLYQVLLNLCVNARDAMADGGTLALTARNLGTDDGNWVYFEVTDTGTGIAPDIVTRVWEPFFTTKQVGAGTGLGLAIVRGIIEENGGTIALHTKQGQGTSFQIKLPAASSAIIPLESPAAIIPKAEGEMILLADDDENVRTLLGAILADHGYVVLSAADGAEALALFAPRHMHVKAVITDSDMPYLDGHGLCTVMRRLNPFLPILMISGRGLKPGDFGDTHFKFIEKPFRSQQLLMHLRELISNPVLG